MTSPKKNWFWCRGNCGTRLIFARRYGSTQVLPYEYEDKETFSIAATGCHVVIDETSFTPREAIEHFQTSGEGRTEKKARELVAGYPSHRAHRCDETGATVSVSQRVRAAIETHRFRYTSEAELQTGLFEAFADADLNPRREAYLKDVGRIDFLVGTAEVRVGVEVKIAGSAEAVLRQMQRYAPHVDELVLVTTKSAHRTLPETVGGKPCTVVLIRGGL